MATAAPKASPPKVVSTPAQARAEANRRARDELKDRRVAETGEHIFLNPDDVRGEYDTKRKLLTTLGDGGRRLITQDDLRQFAHTARTLKKKLGGGITAAQVIDMAREDRRTRAQTQIHFALPLSIKGAVMRLMTNSGMTSHVTRHYVDVQFSDFTAAVASPKSAAEAARALAKGRISMQCDCEDWRYMWRYIATVGGWNYGRAETGFPKITNPRLSGVACKHVVRVARTLGMPIVIKRLEQSIQAGRNDVAPKEIKVTKAEIEAAAKHQDKQRGRAAARIETSAQRADRLAAARALKNPRVAELANPRPKSKSKAGQEAEARLAKASFRKNIAELVKLGALSKDVADAMLKQVT